MTTASIAAATMGSHLRIGGLQLDSAVLIAPMVGITDAPCRQIAHEFGAGLVSTEMVAADAVVRDVEPTLALLDMRRQPFPVAAQLVGSDPQVMAAAAQACAERGAAVVDINLGCPVPRVVNRGSGAALACDIAATAAVVEAMVNAVDVPVTAKMRLGWDHSTINAPQLARALQDVGAAAVTVHGRTRCQKYAGNSDWVEIARVREAVDIPVIGSGDVDDVSRAAARIRSGIVDGVVVARAMLGNFWFVRQAVHFLRTGELLSDLDFAARIELTRRHLEMLCAHYGDERALRIGRKYVAWTVRGCDGAARLRAQVQDLDSRERLHSLLDQALAAGQAPQGFFRPVFTSGEG
ncbi:MAG TPA: tRNA dihydrouridine synthase DusB [Candidatus Dormibacteraeota bacterium]|nr:tRNA dihydrouridine synthase DusB [Candidatus Dormibacteraeota bacterium]